MRAPAKFQGGANAQTRGASCTARTVDDIKISERSNEAIEAVRPLNVYDINHSETNEQRLLRRGNREGGKRRKRASCTAQSALSPNGTHVPNGKLMLTTRARLCVCATLAL